MDSLFLKVIAVSYLGLGALGVLAMCRPGFRSYALAGLVRFPDAAKLTWTLLFSAAASLFGLSLLVMPEISPWLGGATAITYLASSLHEVWVDYGARGHRLLRPGFFILAAVHIGVTILVTFSVLHLHAGSG